jgi:hypothetical protein
MPVRQRAADADPVGGHRDTALQQGAKALHQSGRPIGNVGLRALFDPALLAIALAQQDGGGEPRLGTDSIYMGVY